MTPVTPMGVLHVDGKYFRQEDGTRWYYASLSYFAGFARWCAPSGPDALVRPNLDEYRAIAHEAGYEGDIVLRVFRFARPPNRFAIEPWSYYDAGADRMAAVVDFTRFCNDKGFRVDWTGGDAQGWEVDGDRGRTKHTNLFCRELAAIHATNFVQALNEPFKNGGLDGFTPPQWGTYLRSSGMYYANPAEYAPTNLDFLNFHPDRGTEGAIDKWVGKPIESAPYLWQAGPAPVADEMMGFAEVDKPGSRSSNPDYALLMGLAIGWLGVNFHSTDLMAGDRLPPNTRKCAVNFFRGVAGGVAACKAANF